ncbi:FAD-dependent oxidoreductase [Methylobrevis pamukkalensis]|nr:FAD-dependent oxidoreductase [Methylobrevis pamukkalensis]
MFLAGEAVSDHAFSTAHGAHQSGLDAAGRVIALLAGSTREAMS